MTLDPKYSKKGKRKVCSKALHPEFSDPLVTVAELSIEKGYKPFNWLEPNHPVTTMYLIEAAQRHLDKLKLGYDINNEELKPDGTPTINKPLHAACAAYNLLMLCLQQKQNVLIDDRVFKNGKVISKVQTNQPILSPEVLLEEQVKQSQALHDKQNGIEYVLAKDIRDIDEKNTKPKWVNINDPGP